MKKYFIKIDENNIINDIISYNYENYIEIELEQIPEYFISWIYSYKNWKIELDEVLKANLIKKIEEENNNLELNINENETNWE